MNHSYPHSFKVEMVRRMTGPNAISATQLAKEVAPSQPVLSNWLRNAHAVGLELFYRTTPMNQHNAFSPDDKMRLVLQAAALNDDELGPFLREAGIHLAQLEQWKNAMRQGLSPSTAKTLPSNPRSTKADKKRIKELERELARKDKALAETAALLVLKKKWNALWEDEDESTTTRNEK